MKKTEVKICGMRTIETVQAAISSGATYIGFIIEYPKSSRNISREDARKIIDICRENSSVDFVGVFVDRPITEVLEIIKETGVTIIQLHGSENQEYIGKLREKIQLPVWKFVELKVEKDLSKIEQHTGLTEKVIVDAGKGSGKAIQTELLEKAVKLGIDGIAGGITIKNIGKYLGKYHPEIIDISSGVESEKGIKNIELIKSFMNNVKKTYV